MYIRPAIRMIAEEMERQLQENEQKGGWQDMSPGDLLLRAEEELEEVKNCNVDSELLGEVADVFNFLMMFCDVKGLLSYG